MCPSVSKLLHFAAVFALAAVLPYGYLPARSLVNADPDWGNPETLAGVLKVMTGSSYTGEASNFDFFGSKFWSRAAEAALLFHRQFFLLGAALIVLGTVLVFKRRPLLFRMLAANAAAAVFLGTVYIKTKEYANWYLPAYVSAAVFLAAGLESAGRWAARARRAKRLCRAATLIVALTGSALAARQLYANRALFAGTDHYLARDYGRNLLERLTPGALLFLYGDNPSSAVLALQVGERFRDDIIVIHHNFLTAAWYRTNLRDRGALDLPPEENLPAGEWTAADYSRYALELVQRNPQRDVYFIKPDKLGLPADAPVIPTGMLYKLAKQHSDLTPNPNSWEFRFSKPGFQQHYPRDPQPAVRAAFEEVCLGYFRAYLFAQSALLGTRPQTAMNYGEKALEMIEHLEINRFFPHEAYSGLWTAALRTQQTHRLDLLFARMADERKACMQALMQKKWFDGLLSFADRVARGYPRDADALEYKAIALASSREFARAEQALRELLAVDNRRASAHYNLGNVLSELGRSDQAAEAYRAALRLDPSFTAALQELKKLSAQAPR